MRYPTLDILRGLALISMVTAHVSLLGHPSLSDRLVHEVPWIDGAFYFVAVSGVVSGLVHRRIVEKQGFEASARKLVRRAGFIYLVQIGLVAATITLATIDSTTTLELTPTWSSSAGCCEALSTSRCCGWSPTSPVSCRCTSRSCCRPSRWCGC